jgi:ABC-2 type transport system ATP-binding protein
MPVALKISGLSKTFKFGFIPRKVVALDGVSFEVEKGEIFGLLGPNGAGKTTTIKCILGLIHPDHGSIELLGNPAASSAVRAQIGFLAENPYVYEFLTGLEYLTFSAKLHGHDSITAKKKADELLAFFHLEEAANRRLAKYSKGMLQRIGLAQALLNDPQLLILDEPMSGLDPIGRKEVRDLLISLKNQGRTLLFSSHILSDAEIICDRFALLIKGKAQTVDKTEALMKKIEAYEVTLTGIKDLTLDGISHETITRSDVQWLVKVQSIQEIDAILALSKKHGFSIEAIVPQRQTLEALYLKRLQ